MDSFYKALMKEVSQALRLDNENKFKEAYIKYLTCVLRIVTKLLKEVDQVSDVPRYIKLGQQCLERIMTFIDSSQQKVVPSKSTGTSSYQQVDALPRMSSSKSHDSSLSNSCQSIKASLPNQAEFTKGQTGVSSTGSKQLASSTKQPVYRRLKGLTPMELAYKHNQQLMAAYKGRLERTAGTSTMAANLSLTLQRKMAENLAIAKAQEEALAKKMKERQQRLEEQAAKRFNTPIGMSKEEQEQRQTYKKILEYEQDMKGFAELRQKLETNPDDSTVIQQLFKLIFSQADHPLTQKMKEYQYRIYEKSCALVSKKLDNIEKIRVPLPESMHPCLKKSRSLSDTSKNIEKGNKSFTSSESELEVVVKDGQEKKKEENVSDESSENCLTMANNSNDGQEKEKEEIVSDESSEDCFTMENDSKDEKSGPHSNSDRGENIEDLSTLSVEKDDGVTDINSTNDIHNIEIRNEGADEINNSDSESNNAVECQDVTQDKDTCVEEDSLPRKTDSVLENVTDDVKVDIRKALKEGEVCQEKLMNEIEKTRDITPGVTRDYEKYSEENMDDLFDDDDDDDDDDEMLQRDSVSHQSIPKTSPHSSRTLSNTSDIKSPVDKFSQSNSEKNNQSDMRDRTKENTKNSTSKNGEIQAVQRRKSNSFSDIDAQKLGDMKNEAYHRHLKGISEDVHTYMEKLQLLFTIAYEELDSPEGRDQCYASLEEAFFKPIWQCLLALFRLTNEPKEISAAYIMTIMSQSLPQDFGVVEKLCLEPSEASRENYPYRAAVDELCSLTEQTTLLKKLECIVKVSRLVCQCVDEYYHPVDSLDKRGRTPSIGADDLLPILSYIIIRSRLPQIVSECHMMEEFIHEGYIMGEEGYCLTSMQTALGYVITLGTQEQ